MSDHFVGDTGTIITVETSHDLTAATKLELHVHKPDGETAEWSGTLAGDDNTQIQYTTLVTDFDQPGVYRLQAYLESPDWSGLGDTATFEILSPYAV